MAAARQSPVTHIFRPLLQRFLSQPARRKPDCPGPHLADRLLPVGEPRKPGDPGLDFLPEPQPRPGGSRTLCPRVLCERHLIMT